MIILHNTTGSERVDTVLRGIIGIYEAVFPGRVRGYYLEGGYADGVGIATSDIDLEIVFKDELQEDERSKAPQIGESCALLSAVELDCSITDEKELSSGVVPIFKKSVPIYGEDVRGKFPLMSLDKWTTSRMHAAYWLTINIYHRPESAIYPLTYPDPDGEFYGYDNRTLRLPDGSEVNCTRNLVRTTGWIASALLAYKAGKMLATKRECFQLHHEHLEPKMRNSCVKSTSGAASNGTISSQKTRRIRRRCVTFARERWLLKIASWRSISNFSPETSLIGN